MLTILTNELLFIRKKEIWFYNGGDVRPAAYTTYCYAEKAPAQYDSILKEFTALLDLQQEEKKLHNAISSTFRYHIRKAVTAGIRCVYDVDPSPGHCRELITRFNKFASKKKFTPANSKRILSLQQQKKLIISTAIHNNSTVVTHIYLHDNSRVLLMHTFHDEHGIHPQLRGYANKLLHWEDIRLFRKKGFRLYDFGGINKEELPGITHFKLSFGGRVQQADSYISVKPAYRLFYKWYKKFRRTDHGNK
jgi:lipid II:glycine glycyltransferase (peptidoglycan interpeptide bridge formation enzyme)